MTIEVSHAPSPPAILLPQDGFRIAQLSEWTAELPVRQRSLRFAAFGILVVVFGLGGIWGTTAKIGGSVASAGRVIAADQNTVIQSLEGGLIKSIEVREGDKVQAGQLLGTLNDSAFTSQLQATQVRQALSTIMLQRWRAVEQQKPTLEFDKTQFGDVADDPQVLGTLKSQTDEFNASKQVLDRQLGQIDANISSEKEDIKSLTDLLASYRDQEASVQNELDGLQKLFGQGLVVKSRMTTLQRTLAQLQGQESDSMGAINKSNLNILSYEQQKQGTISASMQTASENISRVQSDLNDQADLIFRLTDRINRSKLTSPINGIIFRVNLTSPGAVLQPAATFMEIFPEGGALAIETELSPRDIGSVKIGQDVDITFPSDQNQMLQPLHGQVDYVSTDSVVNPQTGASHFVVRSKITPDDSGRVVLPGNQAEVYFKTEPKTFVQYIAEPVLRFAMRSFSG